MDQGELAFWAIADDIFFNDLCPVFTFYFGCFPQIDPITTASFQRSLSSRLSQQYYLKNLIKVFFMSDNGSKQIPETPSTIHDPAIFEFPPQRIPCRCGSCNNKAFRQFMPSECFLHLGINAFSKWFPLIIPS